MNGGGGLSRFLVEIFLSHSSDTFGRGILQSFTLFGYRQILCFRELCHEFLLKIFGLTVLKNFAGERFCCVFRKDSGVE